MNRTILSLAIIKSNWEKNRVDFIDNFVPFVATLACERNYNEINPEIFKNDFKDRFGLKIPINVFVTIFNRARKKGVLKLYTRKYYVNHETIDKLNFTIESSDVERKIAKVIDCIQKFSKEEYELDITNSDIEIALLSFLKDHDLDILFANKDKSVLPSVKSTKKLKYLIGSFILSAVEKEPDIFKYIIDIALGHALAGAVLYTEINSFSGKLKDLNIYFDTPLILSLLGYSGTFKKLAIQELINFLNDEKANLFILDTTKAEVDAILNECHTKLGSSNLDLSKASKVIRFCHRNGISSSDVEQKIISLESTLESYNILPNKIPTNIEGKQYHIDEERLSHIIVRTYKQIMSDFNENDQSKISTINRDVKVLSGIYRFRKGARPKTIKDSKHIFITSNTALAFASRVFEAEENGIHFTIPTCLTDVFLSTILWLQSPQKIDELNQKKIIADCYSATQPSSSLINKYLQEIEKLQQEDQFSSDQYYLLRTHRASLNLLEKKTMGDPDAFDGSSAEEILDTLVDSIKSREAAKLAQQIQEHEKTQEELLIARISTEELNSKLESKADGIAEIISNIIFAVLFVITGVCVFINLYSDIIANYVKRFLWIVIGLLSLLNLSNGFNLFGFRKFIKKVIKSKILTWLLK